MVEELKLENSEEIINELEQLKHKETKYCSYSTG